VTAATQVAPRPHAGVIEALRRYRLTAGAVTVLYLVTYLWSIGDIVVTAADQSRFGAVPSIRVAAGWPDKLLRQTAPFSYEPVLAARLTGHIQLLLAPVNVALGLLLGGLAGANLAAAIHLYRTAATCRRRSFAGLLGALPGFLTGFACCAPTLTLLIGAQAAAVLIGLRNWLFPLALAILLAGLAWSTKRLAAGSRPARLRPERHRRAPHRPAILALRNGWSPRIVQDQDPQLAPEDSFDRPRVAGPGGGPEPGGSLLQEPVDELTGRARPEAGPAEPGRAGGRLGHQ
jgi:hypothetical protein